MSIRHYFTSRSRWGHEHRALLSEIQTLEEALAAARKKMAGLEKGNTTLQALNNDLKAQVDGFIKGRTIDPDQWRDIERQLVDRRELFDDSVIIRSWLVANKKTQIAMGKHEGKKLSEIVIAYLSGRDPE